MKINEVTRARVTRNTGNEIEIDNGDGTSTTVDTRKNPNAISRDEQGKLKINTNKNSAMRNNNSRQNQAPRSGEEVQIDDED